MSCIHVHPKKLVETKGQISATHFPSLSSFLVCILFFLFIFFIFYNKNPFQDYFFFKFNFFPMGYVLKQMETVCALPLVQRLRRSGGLRPYRS